jgi:2-polyprenyl-3-methyl-5-hydroxy-6-metoxy-1,4-benzoquinol methylase
MRSCPACGNGQARVIGSKADHRIGRCTGCATLHLVDGGEPPSDYYDGYYDDGNLCVPEFVERRVDEIVDAFESFRRTGRLLDIGCGAGTVLHSARRAGWDCAGVEIATGAVEHLRREGFAVHRGALATAGFEGGQFDVVVAIELVEHLVEPLELLREVARVLRPGGLLFATTPHSRGISVRLRGVESSLVCPPEHLQLLSLRGARALLERAGFTNVSLVTGGVNPSEVMARFSRKPISASGTQRVQSSYALNEAMLSSAPRRAVKNAANGILRVLRLGDSLRISAVR